MNGIPYVDLDTTDTTGENGHLATDGRYSYVDDIEAADAAKEQGEALTIPTGAAVKQYVADHAGDAFPSGGTDGQVLTSDGAGGAAWESVPQPDLTGVLEVESVTVDMGEGINLTADSLKKRTSDGSEQINLLNIAKTVELSSGDIQAKIVNNVNAGIRDFNDVTPGLMLAGIAAECNATNNKDFTQSGEMTAFASPMRSQITLRNETNGATKSFRASSDSVGVSHSGTDDSGSQVDINSFDNSAVIQATTYGDTGTQQASIGLEVQDNTAYIIVGNDGEPTARYSISDTISSTKLTLATGKAVADYVAASVDMSEVVKIDSSGRLTDNDGTLIEDVVIGNLQEGGIQLAAGAMRIMDVNGSAWLMVDSVGKSFQIGSKSVSSITDDASSGSSDALATAKAVKDYVDANTSTVKTASNQDFCEYFGMEYNAEDWS